MRRHFFTTLARVGLAGWLVFDVLNLIGVLHIQIDFSWLSMLVIGLGAWLGIELFATFLTQHNLPTLPWCFDLLAFAGVTWNIIDALAYSAIRPGWYDSLVHALSAAAVASVFYFIFHQLRQSGSIIVPPRTLGFFAFVMTILFCVLYKFTEYFDTILSHDGRLGSGVSGGLHTDGGFFWNVIGAALFTYTAVCVTRWRQRKIYAKKVLP